MHANRLLKSASVSAALAAALAWAPPARAAQGAAGAEPKGPASEADRAEAYHQFLLGSFLEGEDADAAIVALERSVALDPSAAGATAELADLYVRLDRTDDAIQAAGRALAIDPDNVSAHATLGFIYAGRLDNGQRSSARPTAADEENARQATEHLEQAVAHTDGQADANVRATLARLYVRGADYDKAIPLLTTLVAQEPGWRDGPDLLLQAYVGAGKTTDAVAWLEAHAPDDPSLYPTLGDFYDRARRWQDAADAYAAAIKVAPRSAELRRRYASSLMNAGGREQLGLARDALNEALTLRPNDTQVLYLLSQAEQRLGDFNAAETSARQLIAQDANSPWGYYALAQALEPRGQFAAVVDALAPAVARMDASGGATHDAAMLLPHLGFAYQETGRYDEAIKTFEQARALAPADLSLVGYLVQANIEAKRYTQAAAIAHDAREGRADDLRLANLEAQALVKGGKTTQGLQVLQDLVSRNADRAPAYIALAELYQDARRGGDAVRVMRDARERFPKDTSVSFELGAILDRQKRYDEAEAAFRDTIAIDPQHAQALNYLGYMFAERGVHLEESVALLKRALAIEPDNGSYLDSIGWAYYKADNLPLAEDNLRRAAEQLQTNSVIQDHYGDVLASLQRYDEAIDAWTRALQGDGEAIDRGDIEKKIRSARQKIGSRR